MTNGNGFYKCYQCHPKMDIIKSCAHCESDMHFETEFDLENGIDINGNLVHQYYGKYDIYVIGAIAIERHIEAR